MNCSQKMIKVIVSEFGYKEFTYEALWFRFHYAFPFQARNGFDQTLKRLIQKGIIRQTIDNEHTFYRLVDTQITIDLKNRNDNLKVLLLLKGAAIVLKCYQRESLIFIEMSF